ncbi:ABC transporter substrate-binding protein [Bacillus nakamurai]|uniref:ABC transporter substrate-binding protein n=1 Tax=Bacillus nakamurai TaxID=1793963 RepID=A0A150F8Q2_9BACI|nr:transporter substrate-binding domain-containing protein [Bacillus nakamurai]KXZ21467.1 ABC transporter substrate-binding protein [Bacillus nakamurai]KXZ22998.1 ABC transporter substrate-binding protein [Bacillus nakamurai]MCC9021156.1 transporter substrate-binding domain-containing protein [Bacillus nakamurai]MCP6681135.1 transporter substrate-binding domain-containing protein [Bacillus nakamurai]MED1229380.1 transporter substrate-binding domain-containing protein [Bacillus nakamurai]
MKKWLLVLIAACITFALSACGSGNSDSGDGKKKLIMGTSADYKPFEYKDGDKIVGFDVDLAKALGKKTGYDVEVQDMDFNSLITALKSKQVDMILSGMTPTPERKKQVDFSDIYYTANNMIVTKKGSSIKSLKDLKGKTVGVQLGSIQEEKGKQLSSKYGFQLEDRNRISDLTEEIKSGRFDAAIIEDIVAQGYFSSNNDLQGFASEDAKSDESGSAIAFRKDSDVTAKFNKALKEMEKNGDIEKLKKKWFSNEK